MRFRPLSCSSKSLFNDRDAPGERFMTAFRGTQPLLHALDEAPLARGEVAIVGAGPGDPGLLTLRALSMLQQADCLVFDRLVSEEIQIGRASCRERVEV